ncbi:MAG: hypothetical protein KIS88_10155 [Anaerolineales bacterium]|nr:hypothetical protein [Anaerolineales bacterium]
MRSSKLIIVSVLILSAILLSACGSSANTNTDAILTEAAQIAFQALTETAAAAPPTATLTPIPPTPTFTPEPPTPTATLEGEQPTLVPTPLQQPSTSGIPCLRANLEYESIPDGTQIYAKIPFTKVWRLKNTGSCTWKRDFAVIWIQGDLMGAETVVEFSDKEIAPGDYAMVEVSMRAPDRSGFYKGYWMLRGDGAVFGIGNNGREWFWVDIQVLPIADED